MHLRGEGRISLDVKVGHRPCMLTTPFGGLQGVCKAWGHTETHTRDGPVACEARQH